MLQFTTFIIKKVDFDTHTGVATFHYSFDDVISFEESISFGVSDQVGKKAYINQNTLDSQLFSLSIAMGVSYYKLYPTQEIELRRKSLDDKQKKFRQDFYLYGLGEFRYTNTLTPISVGFRFGEEVENTIASIEVPSTNISKSKKYLLCLGGGKDSLVSASLLEKANIEYDVRTFGKHYSIHRDTAALLGVGYLVVERKISSTLIEMNKQGYYNGHIPITGIIHFVSQVVSYLYGYDAVVFSNEQSANVGNTTREGLDINHQWSKSFLFERSFDEYRKKYIADSTLCFSLLRPWHEVKIAREFSQSERFFSTFSSCNRNFHLDGRKSNRWCLKCPKCVFVYTIMRPFVSHDQVMMIWGEELYQHSHLLGLFEELWGIMGFKPFECVGSYEEMQYATWLYLQTHKVDSVVLQSFYDNIFRTKTEQERRHLGEVLMNNGDENLVPLTDKSILS